MKKSAYSKVFFMLFLVLMLPIYTSSVFAQNIPDPGAACKRKASSSMARYKEMDSNLRPMEMVSSILFFISTAITTADKAIKLVANTIGMFDRSVVGCCRVGGFTAGTSCLKMNGIITKWDIAKIPLDAFTCFVNCDWCTTGKSCQGIFSGISNAFGKIAPLAHMPAVGALGSAEGTKGIGQLGLNPYMNIYTAIGCICPVAVVFNLRKLKTIYHVRACCMEQACTNGISTEACDAQLDEALCMYWQGSIAMAAVQVIMTAVSMILGKLLVKLAGKHLLLLNCVSTALDIIEAPKMLDSLKDAWKWMSESFEEPQCSSLGFGKLKKEMEDEYERTYLSAPLPAVEPRYIPPESKPLTLPETLPPWSLQEEEEEGGDIITGTAILYIQDAVPLQPSTHTNLLSSVQDGGYLTETYGKNGLILIRKFYEKDENGVMMLVKTYYDTNNDNAFDTEINQKGAYEIFVPIESQAEGMLGITGKSIIDITGMAVTKEDIQPGAKIMHGGGTLEIISVEDNTVTYKLPNERTITEPIGEFIATVTGPVVPAPTIPQPISIKQQIAEINVKYIDSGATELKTAPKAGVPTPPTPVKIDIKDIKTAQGKLASTDPAERTAALKFLGEQARNKKSAAINALKQEADKGKIDAYNQLASAGILHDPDKWLKSDDADQRQAATNAIGWTRRFDKYEDLRTMLNDGEEKVVSAAMNSLHRLGVDSKTTAILATKLNDPRYARQALNLLAERGGSKGVDAILSSTIDADKIKEALIRSAAFGNIDYKDVVKRLGDKNIEISEKEFTTAAKALKEKELNTKGSLLYNINAQNIAAAKALTHRLLNMLLGEYAYDAVSQMCKQGSNLK